jgi:hypothetical protein
VHGRRLFHIGHKTFCAYDGMFLLLKSRNELPRRTFAVSNNVDMQNRQKKCFICALCAAMMVVTAASWGRNDRRDQVSIRVTEIERMDWGTVAVPPSGTQYVELNPLDQTLKGSGKALFGIPHRGVYKLSAAGNERGAITIDIANVSTNSADLKLDHFEGVYSSIHIKGFPSPTLPAPEQSPRGTPLYLGARATVDAGMNAKELRPTFDIDVIVN